MPPAKNVRQISVCRHLIRETFTNAYDKLTLVGHFHPLWASHYDRRDYFPAPNSQSSNSQSPMASNRLEYASEATNFPSRVFHLAIRRGRSFFSPR
jgi:hypothetical protein